VLFDFVLKFAGFGGEDFDEAAWGADRDLRLIGANVGGEDGIVIVSERRHALAGNDFPEDDTASARATSAVGEEELAAAAEFDVDGLAFGEGEDAEESARFGIKEKDLFLTGNRNDARPRAAGETGDGVQISSVNHRHDWQIAGPLGVGRQVCRRRRLSE